MGSCLPQVGCACGGSPGLSLLGAEVLTPTPIPPINVRAPKISLKKKWRKEKKKAQNDGIMSI